MALDAGIAELRSDPDRLPLGLTLLAGAVAAAVVVPLGWLIVTALGIDPATAIEPPIHP